MQELRNKPSGGGTLHDNYHLLHEIGQGGYGLVYKAKHIRTGQLVAVKTVRLDESDEERYKLRIARFEREADLCARISHPNIVKLLDKGYDSNNKPFAVFELVEGETLKDYIIGQQGLSPDQTKEVMIQVLDALDCAHEKGIIHRDLKPHNIMVSQMASGLHVKILDFGIGAFSKEFRSVDYKSLTLTEEMMGTPNYSAPEQLRGEPPTQRTDLYAWGLILMECLTGKPLVNGRSVAEVFQQQLMPTEIVLPAFVLSHPLAALLRRVLKKNPQHRAFDAKSVLEELIRINISSLHPPAFEARQQEDDVTAVNQFSGRTPRASRKQITVLCVRLDILSTSGASHDLEILDAIEKDQLNLCKDIVMQYGGYIGGVVCNHMVVYFGHPETHDTDARRAARAALEMRKEITNRSENLALMHGLSADLRVAIHTGKTLVFPNQAPEGNVPNMAFKILYKVPPATILVTEHTRKLLEAFDEFSEPVSLQLTDDAEPVVVYPLIRELDHSATPLIRTQSLAREMIGRTNEKAALMRMWHDAASGGQAVMIEGQAGIGKSRLLHELLAELKTSGSKVIQCRCLPEQQNNALYPFLGMLRLNWQLDATEDVADKVSRVAQKLKEAGHDGEEHNTLLCTWLSLPVSNAELLSEIAPEEQKKLLFGILKSCIQQLAGDQQYLLVVEDVHWIDPTSRELIETLLEDNPSQRAMILITSRPEGNLEYPGVEKVQLSPLPAEACAGIVSSILPGEEISQRAIQYILDRTDGVPLYAEEMTSMLVEQGYLIEQKGTYDLISNLDEQAVPNTLQDLLNARLDRLGPAKETAQMAATIGREFDYQLLQGIAQKGKGELHQDIETLKAADILWQEGRGQGKYLFRHALISDAAYDGMTRSFKRGVHLRIAQTLEEQFAETVNESPFLLARHLFEGQSYDKAVEFGLKASNQSVERSASEEAIDNAEKVLMWTQHLEQEEGTTATLELYSVLTSAHMQKGGWAAEEVLAYSERAIDLLRDSERFDDLNPRLWWKILGGVVGGENDELIPVCDEMDGYLDRLNPLNKGAVRCAQAFLCTALGRENVWEETIKYCEEALEFYEQTNAELSEGHENVYGFSVPVFARALLSMAYNTMGDFDEAKKQSEQMLADARACKSAATIGIALMYAAEMYIHHDNKEKTREYTEELVKLSQEFGLEVYEAYGQMQLDWANQVLDHEESTYQVLVDDNSMFSLAHYQSHYADVYANEGRYDKALAKVEKSIAIDERIKHHYYLARLYFLKGKYQWKLGLQSEALDAINKGLSIAKAQGSQHYVDEMEAYLKSIGEG